MAKKNKKHKKRRYIKREQAREIRADNYFKQQADTINRLKPVVEAWKRFGERAARDSQSATQIKKGGE